MIPGRYKMSMIERPFLPLYTFKHTHSYISAIGQDGQLVFNRCGPGCWSSATAVCTTLPYPYTTYSTNAAGLHSAAVARGLMYLGTATDDPDLQDSAYMKQLNNTDDFGQITPGNSLKVWTSSICGFEYRRLMHFV